MPRFDIFDNDYVVELIVNISISPSSCGQFLLIVVLGRAKSVAADSSYLRRIFTDSPPFPFHFTRSGAVFLRVRWC